jgi:hypothetical protein
MFLGSQVSLVRGRVLTERGEGLVGVRVSAAGPLAQGFTLTRYVLAQVYKKLPSNQSLLNMFLYLNFLSMRIYLTA